MAVHVIAFEGPDPYARAGGLAARVDGLTRALCRLGLETHLWFVGDPERPGEELRDGVQLHRWCQWLSRHHPGGVYAGEEDKHADWTRSLPPVLFERYLRPALDRGEEVVVLAEEWQTADSVLALDRLLREDGSRDRVSLLWNANNLFGFQRVAWSELANAAVLTTVSRVMRRHMEAFDVRPLVIPNGVPPEAFVPPPPAGVARLRRHLRGRLVLAKVARWDPDKGWLQAIRSVRALRDAGRRPLLVARGGREPYGAVVREAAARENLRWLDSQRAEDAEAELFRAVQGAGDADIVSLGAPLDSSTLRVLYRAAHAVLVNSHFEPFGLVGLETMAAGGVACTGLTGEDYAVPGRNCLALQTDDPNELVAVLDRLQDHPEEERELRRAAQQTARWFAWETVAKRLLLPRLEILRATASATLSPRVRAQ